ncbi:MAG: double-strand break repair protein AddB [Hyphomicrobiaceae bacterium]
MIGPVGRILTIPAGVPFLEHLAKAVLSGALGDGVPTPESLPRYRIYLPTRRSVRGLQDAFLREAGGRALLLPRLIAIGESDEAALMLLGRSGAGPLPRPVDQRERLLVLTRLVLAWGSAMRDALLSEGAPDPSLAAANPAQSAMLARGLAALIDMIETEAADIGRLGALVPESFSGHWQRTLDFLKIVTEALPAFLRERGLVSSAALRNLALAREAELIATHSPHGPVIVAGVTGSVPATALLMRAVAALPKGIVILPGLDQAVDEAAWTEIEERSPSHPQHRLARLVRTLGLTREQVETLPGVGPDPGRALRHRLVGEVMRPAALTSQWSDLSGRLDASAVREAIRDLSLIEAGSAEEEAEAVALVMRRAAEDPATTVALVSPDRVLARRVAVRLQSWGIRVDDSAGRPLPKTVPGAFLDLVLGALSGSFRPAPLMALLKHPLTRLGLPVAEVRRRARHVELLAFRRPYLGEGLAAVRSALQEAGTEAAGFVPAPRAAARLDAEDRAKAIELVDAVAAAYEPLMSLAGSARSLAQLASAHVAAAEAIAADEAGSPATLWAEEAGEAAAELLTSLRDETIAGPEIALTDYPEFFRTLAQGETVRSRVPVHPRLFIWGPLEARLLQPDVVILGGLNDGIWPERAEPDPWLNRPMLEALGLPPPEARIGDAAHDFTMLLGACRVLMTRAAKIDGVPTVPSRWLMRLEAVLAGLGLDDTLRPSEDAPWLDWARERDRIAERRTIAPPEPAPAVIHRPRQMSVTGVERWMANPYAIFARDILRLEPMPPLSGEPDERLRGIVIHEALTRFGRRHPDRLPDDIAGTLAEIAADVFGELQPHPRVRALWQPRFLRFARWFAATEPELRKGMREVATEVAGALTLIAPAGPFRLTARADRIDLGEDGRLVITDYKSGAVPKQKDVEAGWSPQLPLEAAIAMAGGFDGMTAGRVAGLRYIQAGGGDPPGEVTPIKTEDAATLAGEARAGLERLLAFYDRPETAYRALTRPGAGSRRMDAYAHLARVKEWHGEEAGDDET